jgi:homoserine O-acetyltransferase
MGGMQTWIWAQKYPGHDGRRGADGLAAHGHVRAQLDAAPPADGIDPARPAWNNGNYTAQPPGFQLASVFFATATNGGNHSYMKAGPTREKADAALERG